MLDKLAALEEDEPTEYYDTEVESSERPPSRGMIDDNASLGTGRP